MKDNKNLIIAAVVALMLITSIWAQNQANHRKELARENTALQAELKKADDDVKQAAQLRADLERQKDELKQTQSRFNKAQQKLNELDKEKQALAEKTAAQDEAVKALEAEKDNLLKKAEEMKQSSAAATAQQLAAARKKMDELQKLCAQEKSGLRQQMSKQDAALKAQMTEEQTALKKQMAQKEAALQKQMAQQEAALQKQVAEQKAILKEQEQKLISAAQIIQNEQKQLKGCQVELGEVRPALEKTKHELKDLEAASQQLEEERDKILAEADTLRAQVIGLEKMVEERNAALDQTGKELENCKINNNVLISQISQQGGVQQGGFDLNKKDILLPEQKKMRQQVQKQ
jgi:chromosome segregation ATPase